MELVSFSINQIMNCLANNDIYFTMENKDKSLLRVYVTNNEENILCLREYEGYLGTDPCRYEYKIRLSYLDGKPRMELLEILDGENRPLKFESTGVSSHQLIIKFWKYCIYNISISKQDILNKMLVYDASHITDVSAIDISNNMEVKLEKGPLRSFCKASFEYTNHQKTDDNHHKCHIVLYLDVDIRPNLTYEITCKNAQAEYRNICNSVFKTKNIKIEDHSIGTDNLYIDLDMGEI